MRITSNELGFQAYHVVKQMILKGKLLPGQKIVQDKLAEDLGISRTPLRTALEKLEYESLVESLPRRGMIVKELSPQEVIEIYECRMALECTAIRLICEKAAHIFPTEAKKIFKPFQSKNKVKTQAYQQADLEFHKLIIDTSQNSRLIKIFNQGNLLMHIEQIGLIRPVHETLLEHNQIILAVETVQTKKAVDLVYQHLEASKMLIQKQISDEK